MSKRSDRAYIYQSERGGRTSLPASRNGKDNEYDVEPSFSALFSAPRLTSLTSAAGPASCNWLELEEPLLFWEDSTKSGVTSVPLFVEESEKSDGPMVMKFERAVKLSDIMTFMDVTALGSSLSLSLSRLGVVALVPSQLSARAGVVACGDMGTPASDSSLPLPTRGDARKRFESDVRLSDIIVPIVVVALDTSLSADDEVNPVRVQNGSVRRLSEGGVMGWMERRVLDGRYKRV